MSHFYSKARCYTRFLSLTLSPKFWPSWVSNITALNFCTDLTSIGHIFLQVVSHVLPSETPSVGWLCWPHLQEFSPSSDSILIFLLCELVTVIPHDIAVRLSHPQYIVDFYSSYTVYANLYRGLSILWVLQALGVYVFLDFHYFCS